MTAPTAKIKALLATILQTVLDGNAGGAITTGTTTPPERTFVALLQAELLQRGVVVELPLSTTPTTTKTIATPATNGTSSSGKNTDHDTPLVPLLLVLLRAVQSNAGKSLLREDPSSTAVPPVPLLAGSAVIAGRLAEHLARVFLRMRPEAADAAQADFFAILRSTGSETEATATTELRDMVQSCQTRCREVEDLRFQELLRLMENPNAGDDEESKNGHTTSRAQAFFILAEGYYLRAAQFQPDTPAMWKKAWDCTTERKKVWLARQQPKQLSQDDTSNRDDDEAASVDWEAVTAVSNLRRIAMNKANAKRAAELSLVLTDCYLDALVQPSSRSSSSSGSSSSKTTVRTDTVGSSSSTFKTLLNTFVAPCRSIRPDWTLQQVVELALETLDVSNENEESASSLLSEGDQLYRLLLRLRVFGAQDDAATDAMAETDFARAKNRIEDTTKKTGKIATTSTKLSATPTLQKCWQDARQRHLANCQNSSARFESAVAIRHCLITQKSWNSAAPRIQNATWALLQRHIEWLQERAQVWGIVNSDMTGWSDVSDFAQPLLMHYISQFRNTVSGAESEHESVQTFINGILDSFSEEESCFIEEVCLASARLKWMLAGSLFTKFTDLSLHSMLKILEDRRKNAEKKEKAETINVIGTRSPENCNFIQLQSALAAVGALLVLDSPAEENDGLHRIADLATSRSAQIDVCSGEMGHAYLEFLVCWSGLHKTPWSHCSQPDARLLARKARASLDNAKSQWGRRISEAELVLFDLGEADIEGVVFDSGLVNEAIKKYKLLSAASEKLPDQFLADLVAVRCYSALAELSMRNHSGPSNVFESEPSMVSLARRGLERLETIPPIHSNQNVYFWSSSNFYESSIRFQIAKSRQLIADALLRSGDTTGAQSFLEDAVRDAPLNSSAAFSLGRFRLYVAVFGIDGSADSAKAAQVQLLRAAKLDPTKAGPFALLGYWYEGVKDNQRALGCYSKALQIDASHPVAGRGVIRLAPRELLLKAFDRATASSFAIVGWAWYAIGLQQAFVDGDDDLAIVSLLRAVRCRDIDRPEGEVLGAFFSDPLLPELPQHKELSSALAVLAACYRRLGRFTAALRSYHSAINEARDDISSALLCACAQGKQIPPSTIETMLAVAHSLF